MASALEQARQLLAREIFPGDVVAAIIGTSGVRELPSSELFLSSVFYDFSLRKPHLFEDFDFFSGATFPFTDVLTEQLANLEAEKYLGKPNPTYRHLVVRDEPNATDWLEKRVLSKFAARGWLEDVRELGALLGERVEARISRETADSE